MATQKLSEIQNRIDNIKEHISDMDYLDLCNSMKELYKKKEEEEDQNKLKTYVVSVFHPLFSKHDDDDESVSNTHDLELRLNKIILQMPVSKFVQIKGNIESSGFFALSCRELDVNFNPYRDDNHQTALHLSNNNCESEFIHIFTHHYNIIKIVEL